MRQMEPTFLPAPDGSYLLTGEGRTRQSVAKFSVRDADAVEAFSRDGAVVTSGAVRRAARD